MKKMITRITALILAVLLLLTLCISAAAAENGSPMLANVLDPNDPNAKPVGVFALRLRLGAEMTYMTAFLVKNGSSQYILTHSILASYVEEGYEMTLMGADGKNNIATFLGVDEDYELAYLFADGMKEFEPLKFSRDKFATKIALVLSFLNSNYSAAKDVEFRSYDFARFAQLTDRYFVEEKKEITLQWLGCPVLPERNTLEVQGICTAIKDKSDDMVLGIINFEKLELNTAYALDAKPVEMKPVETMPVQTKPVETESQPTEAAEEKETSGNGIFVTVGIVLAAVVLGFFLLQMQKNKKPTKTAGAAGQPKADWVLHCVSGPLNGWTFPVTGTLRIGSGSDVSIRLPESTPGISERHCEVSYDGTCVVLRDLNSAYGTYVSIHRLEPGKAYKLNHGDSFTLAPNGPGFQLEKTAN